MLTRLLLPALLVLLAAGAARTSASDNQNAARWYARSIDALERLSDQDRRYLRGFANGTLEPTPEIRQIVARGRVAIGFGQRGARLPENDQGLDYARGFELGLPHLHQMQTLARLMQADAAVRMHDGDVANAAQLLADGYRMAGHVSSDHIIISSLVASSAFTTIDRAVQHALDRAQLSAEDSERLLGAIRQLDQNDPFDIVESIATEQGIAIDYLSGVYEEGGGEGLRDALTDINVPEGPAAILGSMEGEEFEQELDRYDRLMDEVVGIFAMEDRDAARQKLDELAVAVEAGDHGLLALLVAPVHSRLIDQMDQGRDAVRSRTALLAQIASGAVSPADEANAAVYYLRAIEMLGELDGREALVPIDADPVRPVEPPLDEVLLEASPVVDVVREGSLKRRCDFGYARRRELAFVQPYGPGLRDLLRLLHVDTRRLLQAGDFDGATDRLTIALRMVAHLGGDEALVTAVIAHEGLLRTVALSERLLASADDPESRKAALFEAIRKIGHKDPFGYIAAVRAERERLSAHLVRAAGIPPATSWIEQIERTVPEWSGVQVLYAMAVLDSPEIEQAPPDPLAPLADILDAEPLRLARERAVRIRSELTIGELSLCRDEPAQDVADLDRRMKQARSDLRAARLMLRTSDRSSVGAAP
ncbi:MAG: hypothetical protein ACYTJ0_06200 [Planctomycetota bacterium]|jgi:hypothetical protein